METVRRRQRLTLTDWAVIAISMSAIAAPFWWGRVVLPGLPTIHLYLIVAMPVMLSQMAGNLWTLPRHYFDRLLLILCGLLVSILIGPGGGMLGLVIKYSASFLTIIVAANLIQSRRAFVAASLAMVGAVTVLCVYAIGFFLTTGKHVTDIIETGNKNALSMYILPGFLLGMILLRSNLISRTTKILVLIGATMMMATMLSSWNRSGWVGAAVVVILVVSINVQSRNASRVTIAVVVALCMFVMTQINTVSLMQQRYENAQAKTGSDEIRVAIVEKGIEIFFNNPLFGVSPQRLPRELGEIRETRANVHDPSLSSHNLPVTILAGHGALGVLCILAFVYLLWRAGFPHIRRARDADDQLMIATMGVLLILWAFRGLFTDEILFSPTFNLAIGYALGIRFNLAREFRHQPVSWWPSWQHSSQR